MVRKIRRREEWMDLWRLELSAGRYPRAVIRREVRTLQREIRALLGVSHVPDVV